MKKMCLVSIFSALLTALAACAAVAAPDEVSGIPSITDGNSIRIGNLRIRIHGGVVTLLHGRAANWHRTQAQAAAVAVCHRPIA